MVKTLFLLLLILSCICCGCSSQTTGNEPPVEHSVSLPTNESSVQPEPEDAVLPLSVNEGWSERLEQTNLLEEEGVSFRGINEDGFFYEEAVPREVPSDIAYSNYVFQYWSGEREVLLEGVNYYYSTFGMCGDTLIVGLNLYGDEEDEGTTLYMLTPSEPAQEIWKQTDFVMPGLYDNGRELIMVVRDKDADTGNSVSRLIAYQLDTQEYQVIAETEMSRYRQGEQIMCAGGNDKDIYYVVNHGAGGVDEIVRYSRTEEKIVARCEMDYFVDFVTGVDDKVIISQTSNREYLSQGGYVGILSDGCFEKVCEIPYVNASQKIRRAWITSEGIYFAAPHYGYFLELKEEARLYTHDFNDSKGQEDFLGGGFVVNDSGVWTLTNGELWHYQVP